jgi:hypothetical protein
MEGPYKSSAPALAKLYKLMSSLLNCDYRGEMSFVKTSLLRELLLSPLLV